MANRAAVGGRRHGPVLRERVALCTAIDDVRRLTKMVAADHGFAYFAVLRLPSFKDEELAALALVYNWPEELVTEFDDRRLLKHSPSLNALKTSTRPFFWSYRPLSRHYIGDKAPAMEHRLTAFGIINGVCLSVHDRAGRRGMVVFAGDRPLPDESELAGLSYFANLVYERVSEFQPGSRAALAQKLSLREHECLMWTASGKTSAEIAAILKLSEHTVNHYLAAVCKKLGAANRSHAVYKAMQAGIIG